MSNNLVEADNASSRKGLEEAADELAAIFATIVLKVSNRYRGEA